MGPFSYLIYKRIMSQGLTIVQYLLNTFGNFGQLGNGTAVADFPYALPVLGFYFTTCDASLLRKPSQKFQSLSLTVDGRYEASIELSRHSCSIRGFLVLIPAIFRSLSGEV